MVFKLTISVALAVIFAAAPVIARGDVIDIVNSIRTRGCGGLAGTESLLRPDNRLDEAARRVARGNSLREATTGAGYRAKRSVSIDILTTKGVGRVAEIIEERFCDSVVDAAFKEIGVFRRGDETWILLAVPFSPPASAEATAVGTRALELINEARSRPRRCGRKKFAAAPPLKYSAALEAAALVHARDMAAHSFMGHEGSDGSKPSERVAREGYDWRNVAENVAAGQTTAEEVVAIWVKSPEHCENLMDPTYTEAGIAYAFDSESELGSYWAQVYGRPR